jgi:hypothetical protein
MVAMSTIIRRQRAATEGSRNGPDSSPPQCRRPLSPTTALLAPLVFLVAGVAGLGGCASQSGAVAEAGMRQPTPEPGYGLPERLASAELQVVDCQLPPRIHRLGIHLTYLGAERQITTTSRECAIRGGDAAAPDTSSRA